VDDLVVDLDADYYKVVDALADRFPAGAPSLVGCTSFSVEGDVEFGAGVVAEGDVAVAAAGTGRIADGSVLRGRVAL
jgi:UTP--glucose-1-phosphate uridylyltransferase